MNSKMKHFRAYPWGLQLLLFGCMFVFMWSLSSILLISLLPKFSAYSLIQIEGISEQSPAKLINTALIVQGVLSLIIFLVSSLAFAFLTHPRPATYLGLRKPGRPIQLLLVIGLMLGAIPILELFESLVSHINFGPKVKASQEANDHMMGAFLTMPDFTSFIRTFLIMAIFPAVGEELFFRGLLLRLAKRKFVTMYFPIFFTSVIFAYFHSNIYGFISIFLAGVLLSSIYYLTGSLWCSMLAHLVFNGSQVVLSYVGKNNAGVKAFMESNTVPVYLILTGAFLFALSLFLLWKNSTPLPDDWTNDFTPEENHENKPDIMQNETQY